MLNIIILSVYLLIIIIIGIKAGQKVHNIADFAVAGRNYGAIIIFATLSASFIGGGFSTGNAEKVFIYGIANIVFLFGFSFQIILVSLFLAPKMDKYKEAITAGDIIRIHYGKNAQIITGFLSVIICTGILGAQVGAMGYIFNVFLNLPRLYGILIGCSIVILYSTLGGMKAVVASDVLQFIVLSIGIPLTLLFGIFHAGGIKEIIASTPANHFNFIPDNFTIISAISLFLTFLVGETLVPPYVQRLLMSSEAKKTAKGTYYSGLYSIPFFTITGLIGLVALSINPELNPNLALPHVIKTVLPLGISGIVIAAMISIIMSSADSFLNSASVAIVNDIVLPLKKNKINDKKQLKIAQLTNLLAGIFSVIFALKIESILDILLYSYNFWAPVILIPLISGILGLKVSARNFTAGIIGGVLFYTVSALFLINIVEIDSIIVGLAGNIIFFFGSTAIEK